VTAVEITNSCNITIFWAVIPCDLIPAVFQRRNLLSLCSALLIAATGSPITVSTYWPLGVISLMTAVLILLRGTQTFLFTHFCMSSPSNTIIFYLDIEKSVEHNKRWYIVTQGNYFQPNCGVIIRAAIK
jgi:hypothetical protein